MPTAVVARIEEAVFLFDCGEGTQRQLIRAGVSRSKIQYIAITHLHGDHVLGLVPLLASMASDRREAPLHLIGPQGLRELVESTLRWTDVTLPFELHVRELPPDFRGEIAVASKWSLHCAPLRHSIPSFGFRLQERRLPAFDPQRLAEFGLASGPLLGELKRRGWVELPTGERVTLEQVTRPRSQPTLVYCGDTRPCSEAIELARAADVLLYEATFGSTHAELAEETCHSTAAEAASVAAAAGVGRLLLVHISGRYSSAEPLLQEACAIFPNTELAEELCWETITGSDPFNDQGQSLADSDAEGRQSVASVPSVQRAYQRPSQPGTAHP